MDFRVPGVDFKLNIRCNSTPSSYGWWDWESQRWCNTPIAAEWGRGESSLSLQNDFYYHFMKLLNKSSPKWDNQCERPHWPKCISLPSPSQCLRFSLVTSSGSISVLVWTDRCPPFKCQVKANWSMIQVTGSNSFFRNSALGLLVSLPQQTLMHLCIFLLFREELSGTMRRG